MRRTTTRRRRAVTDFLADNRRLFPFVGLFLAGVILGVAVYVTAGSRITDDWGALLTCRGISGGLRTGLRALWSSCFSTFLLLGVLCLLGLWSCGAPFVLLVPVFQGLGLGLTEAYYYSLGGRGVAAVAAVIMPHGLLTAAVLAMAGAESLRLCTSLSRQLLPPAAEPSADSGSAPAGGLWNTFRLYCLRYLLFVLGAAGAGLTEVLLRTLFCRLLP